MPEVRNGPPGTPPLELDGGAELALTADGVLAAAHYGEPRQEQRRLLTGCGLVDRLWVEHLELAGEDRQRFLNGLVTCDVKGLEPGAGAFGFLTSVQGRILTEARIEAGTDTLRVELPHGRAAATATHLSRYIVADRVEVAALESLRVLTLMGPESLRVAARIGPADRLASRWSHLRADWAGVEASLSREERLGAPAVTLRCPAETAAELAAELLRPIDGLAAAPAGFLAVEAVRVEAGLARFGPDFGPEQFPQEVGAEEALDFDKGCYLGQEVVARIHYRGKVNHRLCGLRLLADELPAPASPVLLGERAVGRTGTAVRSPRLEASIALAILHRRAEAGARVEAGGIASEVVNLPFVEE